MKLSKFKYVWYNLIIQHEIFVTWLKHLTWRSLLIWRPKPQSWKCLRCCISLGTNFFRHNLQSNHGDGRRQGRETSNTNKLRNYFDGVAMSTKTNQKGKAYAFTSREISNFKATVTDTQFFYLCIICKSSGIRVKTLNYTLSIGTQVLVLDKHGRFWYYSNNWLVRQEFC